MNKISLKECLWQVNFTKDLKAKSLRISFSFTQKSLQWAVKVEGEHQITHSVCHHYHLIILAKLWLINLKKIIIKNCRPRSTGKEKYSWRNL